MAKFSRWQRWLYIASLMLAGESIYMLPYMRKTFQTSMEQVFSVSATELGLLNSMFGVMALLCYFPGGWLADHFPARNLLALSLFSTGLGGLYMATIPGYTGLLVLHAFWGITTILMFWAALIKATRAWGATHEQGRAFGLLDGGRGFVGAGLATLATVAFALSADVSSGLVAVILVYSLTAMGAALAVWMLIPSDSGVSTQSKDQPSTLKSAAKIRYALQLPQIWLLAVIILAAYMLFIGTYDLPGYAERGFDQSKVFGATLATFRDWLRPIAAIAAGFLADRIRPTRVVGIAFAILCISYGSLFMVPAENSLIGLMWIQVSAIAIAVFALRGVYYALLGQSGIPMMLTGTAVGIVSVIGYMPDMFSHVLAGWFVDSHPGILGYQYYFGLLTVIAFIGLLATMAIALYDKKPEQYRGFNSEVQR